VAARLAKAGHQALFAGGCVRDRLLGLDPADYDVATDATPEEIRAIFPRAIGVGESFGVMLVRHGGRSVEVATFRADGPYGDGRRPESVRFTDAREDALRRDFTINGLFEDPATGEIIDHVGGQADLRARVLRAIGDPAARLGEDRLRALRAVRFAARHALAIEPGTLAAIRATARDLGAVSRERIGHEIRRMLAHPTRAAAVALCEDLGLASVALREPDMPLEARWLRALPPGAAVSTALAAWMLGRGSRNAAHGTAESSADRKRAAAWRAALLLSNEESAALEGTLETRANILARWQEGDTAARKRLASREAFGPALQLVEGEDASRAAEIRAAVARLAETGLAPAPFVTGDDLVAAGLAPGPAFRRMLESLYDRQLNGVLTSREQALSEVSRLASER
jgi:tRNA nucleotidyltransferase/poly(A) polymerase